MQNGIFQTDWKAVGEAVLSAVVFAVVAGIVSVVATQGFDVFSTDWIMVGKNMLNIGVIAGVVTFGNNLLSTNSGSLLGVGPSK